MPKDGWSALPGCVALGRALPLSVSSFCAALKRGEKPTSQGDRIGGRRQGCGSRQGLEMQGRSLLPW